ncbi:hypothetical protein BX616_000274 [Lobosporangium transversale]|nr:hypothetical protein BX616_000274 [Lobosporangium transversale]
MPEAKIYAALHVAEILFSIALHLSRNDFLCTLRVCRFWHAHLLPLLWHTIRLPPRLPALRALSSFEIGATSNNANINDDNNDGSPSLPGFPSTGIFQERAHLIRSLNCNNIQYHQRYLIPYCNQLTRLEIVDLTEEALPFLRLNMKTLVSIDFVRERNLVRRPFEILNFLRTLDQAPSLDQMRLENVSIDGPLDEENAEEYIAQRRRDNMDRRRPMPPLSLPSPVSPTSLPFSSSSLSSSQVSTTAAIGAPIIIRTMEEKAEAIALFYQILHRLSVVELIGAVIETPPPIESDIFYRIRRLTIRKSTMSIRGQLQIISQCQYLTHLTLQLIGENNSHSHNNDGLLRSRSRSELSLEEELEIERLESCCPHITHLDVSLSTIRDRELAALVRQLPGLISLRAQVTNMAQETVETLIGPKSRVREQLQELDVVDARPMQTDLTQRILCSCTRLKRFRGSYVHVHQLIRSLKEDLTHTSTTATQITNDMVKNSPSTSTNSIMSSFPSFLSLGWVCLELEELQLSFIGIGDLSPDEDEIVEPEARRQLKLQEQLNVYNQLSKLRRLRVLHLGGNNNSTWRRTMTFTLSLKSGFETLETLKELREFSFNYMFHQLGLEEIEFMVKHWPKLRKVVGILRVVDPLPSNTSSESTAQQQEVAKGKEVSTASIATTASSGYANGNIRKSRFHFWKKMGVKSEADPNVEDRT